MGGGALLGECDRLLVCVVTHPLCSNAGMEGRPSVCSADETKEPIIGEALLGGGLKPPPRISYGFSLPAFLAPFCSLKRRLPAGVLLPCGTGLTSGKESFF